MILAAAAIAISSLATATAMAAQATPVAHAARTLNVTDTAHLRYTKEVGSMLEDEGSATGALPGRVAVQFSVGATVYASFTIYAKGGSITGHSTGQLHGAGLYASFGGTMTVTHGTGRYAHARGTGGFYGVIDRHNYAATVQTTGTLHY